jgi:hypothetical protein
MKQVTKYYFVVFYCSETPGDGEMAILLDSVLKVVEAQVSEGSACQTGCN